MTARGCAAQSHADSSATALFYRVTTELSHAKNVDIELFDQVRSPLAGEATVDVLRAEKSSNPPGPGGACGSIPLGPKPSGLTIYAVFSRASMMVQIGRRAFRCRENTCELRCYCGWLLHRKQCWPG
jgi:hypothetical protein